MGWLVLNCNIINAGIMYQKTNHQYVIKWLGYC